MVLYSNIIIIIIIMIIIKCVIYGSKFKRTSFLYFSFLSSSFLVPLFGSTEVCNYLSQFVISLRTSSLGAL